MNAAQALLTRHRASLVSLIEANDAAQVDRIGRIILDDLNKRAVRMIAQIDQDMGRIIEGPFGTAGKWGENGKAVLIRALIREAASQRKQAAIPDLTPIPTSVVKPDPTIWGDERKVA